MDNNLRLLFLNVSPRNTKRPAFIANPRLIHGFSKRTVVAIAVTMFAEARKP